MSAELLQFDTQLFLVLNGLHADWADGFFFLISQIWIWIPVYLFIILLVIKAYRKRACIVLITMVLTIVCTDQSCNVLKRGIGRFRPSHTEMLAKDIHLVQNYKGETYYGGQYGFPSAHAANTMALALLVIFFLAKGKKWVAVVAICWSLLSGYSRLYLGVHYPLDVLCGFLLGSCYSILFCFLYKKSMRVFKRAS